MINIRDILLHSLRADVDLAAAVGTDKDGEIKVYKIPVKKNVAAPYVTIQSIPVNGVEPAYGDSEVIEKFLVAITAWAKTPKIAWTILPTLDTAMKRMTPTLPSTYGLKLVQRYQTPVEQEEPDSRLTGVVVRYELFVAR